MRLKTNNAYRAKRVKGNRAPLSEEFLLECLRNFKEIKGRMPFPSDTNNGLIPSKNFYIKSFKSFNQAKILAFK